MIDEIDEEGVCQSLASNESPLEKISDLKIQILKQIPLIVAH